MAMIINPESVLGQELAKWEKPYRFEPYPKMLYRAVQLENGQMAVTGRPQDYITDPEIARETAITNRCQRIVRNEPEEQRAAAEGWCVTAPEALLHAERLQQDIAQAAAERHYRDQRMSAKAQTEVKAVDDATHEHVPDPPAPTKRARGRKVAVLAE